MAYTTASDILATYDFDDAATDTVGITLITLISEAEAIIESVTGRKFNVTTDLWTARNFTYLDDVDGLVLYLDEDLFAVGSDGITAGADSIEATDYVTEPRNETPYYALTMKETSSKVWSNPDSDNVIENAISVPGQWGYSATPPGDIVWATKRLAFYMYKQRNTSSDLDRPLLTGSGETIMPAAIPSDVLKVLKRYMKKLVASG